MTETDIFRALADPTRRTVFERLAAGESNATQLRAGLPITQPAMSQHLSVLYQAGLIEQRRDGRHVQYRLRPDGLRPLHDWMMRYRAFWPDRIERLKQLLEETGHVADHTDRGQ